jgi:hypothetical protein
MSAVLSIEKNIPYHKQISTIHTNKEMLSKTLFMEQNNIKKDFQKINQEKFQTYIPQGFEKPFTISASSKMNIFLPENVELHSANKPFQQATGENTEKDLLLNLSRVRQNVSKTFFGALIPN